LAPTYHPSPTNTINPTSTQNTTLVTLRLINSQGQGIAGGTAQYYNGSWLAIPGNTDNNGNLTYSLPGNKQSVSFHMTYAGGSSNITQNIATNSTVTFQTAKVVSVSGTCIKYYAGSWLNFVNGMELLPGKYIFRFSDGTPDTAFTMTSGVANNIH